MSSISPHPDGVSGPPGNNDGSPDNSDAATPQGGFGNGPSATPPGYPPGAVSSGAAAFASPPPSAAPGITPPGHQSRPNQGGHPTPPPAGPQGYGPASYGNAPAPQHPGGYGPPPGQQPNQNQAYGNPQGQPYGAPQQHYGSPPPPHGPAQQGPAGPPQRPAGPPHAYGQPGQGGHGGQQGQPSHQSQPGQGGYGQQGHPGQPGQQNHQNQQGHPSQPGQQNHQNQQGHPSQPGQYGQSAPPPYPGSPQQPQQGRPAPVGAPNPQGKVPQAPYATRVEPGRDMPMAGASPIRRNLDDTAELPAFLDSARSDEGPGTESRKAEVKPQVRKFPLTTGFTALLRHRYAMSVLVRRDLAVKYQSTVMGYVWSLIEPLGLTLIYWFVFDLVFGGGNDLPGTSGYLLFIVSGIFAYQWFSSAVNEGAKSLGGQASLITVMKVPREVFPISKTFARFAEYVVGFPILIIVAIMDGGVFGFNMLWLIPAILVQATLLAGMTFILAATNVLYKDVQRFLPLIMRVFFYASAIIYPVTKVSEAPTMKENPWLFDIFSTNPLVGIFSMHRAAFNPELAPNMYQLGVAVGFSVFLMFFGRWVFYKFEPRVLKAL